MSAPARTTALDDAWQRALATEHAAIWGYGRLGPELSDPAQVAQARTDEAAHRAQRDATTTAMTAAGVTPVAAHPDYPLPFAIGDPVSAAHLALRLEESTAAAWRYEIAVAGSLGSAPPAGIAARRAAALDALVAAAVRAVQWRQITDPANPTVPFPGI